ncbi:hypothetical protein DFH09DRAFT_1370479 [Mycena vulgaris]|nr:hypothetical protein DFH09DRAFT_1370479 [Mycena vulgaris]
MLPQELVDKVIDDTWHTGSDGVDGAMKACGLVCKSRLHRSRFHLFSRVAIDADNLPLFIDIVDTSLLPILSFIRDLQLRFRASRPPLDDVLLTRMHRCPNLTRIEAKIVTCESGERVLLQELPPSLHTHLPFWSSAAPSFSRLDLRVQELPSRLHLSEIFDIASRIPSLGSLGIYAYHSSIVDDSATTSCSLPLRLHTLNIDVVYGVGTLIQRLLSGPTLPTFKSLALTDRIQGPGADFEPFLQRAGGELEYVSLRFYVWEIAQLGRALVHTPKLRNLELLITSRSLPPDILSVLPPCEWETISFVVSRTKRHLLMKRHLLSVWGAIDQALADPRFRTLRRFRFSREKNIVNTTSLITPETKLLMPLSNARGILE